MPRAMANTVPHGKTAMKGDPTIKPPLTGQTVGGGVAKVNEKKGVFLPIKKAASDMPRKRKLPISPKIQMLRMEVKHAPGEAIIRE